MTPICKHGVVLHEGRGKGESFQVADGVAATEETSP